jgi:DNA helicase-2/ATP-dependent DNA helicase PcrA
MCYAEQRRLHGREHFCVPSRFVSELPSEQLQEIRPRVMVKRPVVNNARRSTLGGSVEGFNVGQRVAHKKFGEGIVMNYEGQGSHARVQVNFEDVGSKWLVLSYANLQIL